jgi:hypothetical protein
MDTIHSSDDKNIKWLGESSTNDIYKQDTIYLYEQNIYFMNYI